MIYEAIHVCIARIAGFLWGVGIDITDKNYEQILFSLCGAFTWPFSSKREALKGLKERTQKEARELRLQVSSYSKDQRLKIAKP
jgi:hypothetical protein